MWVRGLKQNGCAHSVRCLSVAPYVGAWIETRFSLGQWQREEVAPYVGAWIETHSFLVLKDWQGSRTLCGCVD